MCGMENPCHARVEGPYYQPYNLKLELIFFYKIKKQAKRYISLVERGGELQSTFRFPPFSVESDQGSRHACRQPGRPAGEHHHLIAYWVHIGLLLTTLKGQLQICF